MSWNKYFIEMLSVIAAKSKDKSTKVGSIITTKEHTIVSTGFNGFPRGVKEDESVSERFDRPLKYKFTEHSERNAIFASARHGIALNGCTIYQSWLPCTDCARAIIQVGIKKIVVDGRTYLDSRKYWDERWFDDMVVSVDMIREADVKIHFWKDDYLAIMSDYRLTGDLEWHKEKDFGTTQKQI